MGKSAIAEAAATTYGASILSVDSMQVYRGMDIGTAKPSLATRERVPYHLIDVAAPDDHFSAAEFQRQGRVVLDNAVATGARVIIAGGSGLHFRALVDPMMFPPTDPEIRRELEAMPFDELQNLLLAIDHKAPDFLDLHNPRRVTRAVEIWRITTWTPSERAAFPESVAMREYRATTCHVSLGIDSRGHFGAQIEERFATMLDDGFFAEVEYLAPMMGRTAAQAVGYREFLDVLRGGATFEVASEAVLRATHSLVKRQRTFFGKDPRIEWLAWQASEDARIKAALRRIGEVTGWTS